MAGRRHLILQSSDKSVSVLFINHASDISHRAVPLNNRSSSCRHILYVKRDGTHTEPPQRPTHRNTGLCESNKHGRPMLFRLHTSRSEFIVIGVFMVDSELHMVVTLPQCEVV